MLGADVYSIVSGGHTRSIQIATPTVGGLMKFAVKTVTCMGCKTPLRTNNSVASELVPDYFSTVKLTTTQSRWSGLQ